MATVTAIPTEVRKSATNIGRVTQVIGSTFDVEFDDAPPAGDLQRREDRIHEQGREDQPHRRSAAALGRRPRPLRRPGQHRRPGPRPGMRRHRRRRSRCRSARPRSAACSICWASRSTAAARSMPRSAGRSTAIARKLADLSTKTELFETGIKVIDLLTPFVRGGKAGSVRRGRPGQDGHSHRADRPHRQRARRLLGVRRRRRANPRRDRPVARNAGSRNRRDRPQGHRADLHGVRPDERAARRPSPRRPLGPDDGRVLPRHDRRRHAAVHR